jgi:hypothetical protein
MDSARTTKGGAAAELCAGHAEHIAYYPEQWSVVIDVHAVSGSVNLETIGHGFLEGGWGRGKGGVDTSKKAVGEHLRSRQILNEDTPEASTCPRVAD